MMCFHPTRSHFCCARFCVRPVWTIDRLTEHAFETAAAAVDKVMRAHALPELKRSVLFHSMRGRKRLR